ncbi:hypothetical protein, partial [Pseudomonas aeruginosa]|uniref:hypothetical protein n=1 Tax=Pseudomonas aeruginosa TaxID=287 RepID=UPI002FB797E8
AKKALPHVTIIAGGENVTASWSQMLDRSPGLDICILGEGEAKMSAVVAAIEKNEAWENIEGIAYRKDGVPVKTGLGARITKVDALP